MTAFIVESYKTLAPDPTDTIIFLLQQIALQTNSYSIQGTVVNSTVPPSANALPLPFQPPFNAKRVNLLWFASLILALVCASLGITVKQWLREYLAGDYTSPQVRLRIRDFRYPGLVRWKVFEIAAVLPMLVQLSLILFLVGLCYFTADVHQAIGQTSLTLVLAWAFFFVSCMFLPMTDPACPFKTPVMKTSGIVSGVRSLLAT